MPCKPLHRHGYAGKVERGRNFSQSRSGLRLNGYGIPRCPETQCGPLDEHRFVPYALPRVTGVGLVGLDHVSGTSHVSTCLKLAKAQCFGDRGIRSYFGSCCLHRLQMSSPAQLSDWERLSCHEDDDGLAAPSSVVLDQRGAGAAWLAAALAVAPHVDRGRGRGVSCDEDEDEAARAKESGKQFAITTTAKAAKAKKSAATAVTAAPATAAPTTALPAAPATAAPTTALPGAPTATRETSVVVEQEARKQEKSPEPAPGPPAAMERKARGQEKSTETPAPAPAVPTVVDQEARKQERSPETIAPAPTAPTVANQEACKQERFTAAEPQAAQAKAAPAVVEQEARKQEARKQDKSHGYGYVPGGPMGVADEVKLRGKAAMARTSPFATCCRRR